MKLHPSTVMKLQELHNWAIELGKPFTQAEMQIARGYSSESTAKVDLKMLVNMNLLACEKKVIDKCVRCVYSLGTRKFFPEPTVDGLVRSGNSADYGVAKQQAIIKPAVQIGVDRPWYLTCLFGDWKAV